MTDQASKLRKIIDGNKSSIALIQKDNAEIAEVDGEILTKRNSRVITITSGKGGVGKTNFAVNTAIALMQQGQRVVILDADFGLANIEVVLGTIPKFTLLDVIKNKKNILEIISHGPNNVRFISGGSGVEELSRLSVTEINNFMKNINLLDSLFDIIIVDTGAGVSENVINMILAGDDVLVVTTPEPTSITDAYALIKIISSKSKDKNIKIIINRAESEKEAELVYSNLKEVVAKYLGNNIEFLGYLSQDDSVKRAVKKQNPFMISYPGSLISKQIIEISKKIVELKTQTNSKSHSGAKAFIKKFLQFVKNR
jgi:flagellar biosynthesis protein FlhG